MAGKRFGQRALLVGSATTRSPMASRHRGLRLPSSCRRNCHRRRSHEAPTAQGQGPSRLARPARGLRWRLGHRNEREGDRSAPARGRGRKVGRDLETAVAGCTCRKSPRGTPTSSGELVALISDSSSRRASRSQISGKQHDLPRALVLQGGRQKNGECVETRGFGPWTTVFQTPWTTTTSDTCIGIGQIGCTACYHHEETEQHRQLPPSAV